MRSPIETGIRFNKDRVNTKSAPETLAPESPIARAMEMLVAEGEPQLNLDQITVIPVEVEKGFSISIRFQGSQGEGEGKKKGVNFHVLQIQRAEDTQLSPGHLSSAVSLGYDTSDDALVGIVNGRRPVFFHPDQVIVSEETTYLQISPDTAVNVPLYAPIPFQGENGKGVVIVTRYPSERIDVSKENNLSSPRGTVSPDKNILRRKTPILPPEKKTPGAVVYGQPSTEPLVSGPPSLAPEEPLTDYQPPELSSESLAGAIAFDSQPHSLSEPLPRQSDVVADSETAATELSGSALDQLAGALVKEWNGKKYSAILSILRDPKSSPAERAQALSNFDHRLISTGDPSNADLLFSRIAHRIAELENSYDTALKINGPMFEFKTPFMGKGHWAVNLDQLKADRERYQKAFELPETHNETTYTEFMARWFLLDQKWAQQARWS